MKNITHSILALGLFGWALLATSQPAWAVGERLVTQKELDEYEAIGPQETYKLVKGETPIGDKQKKEISLLAKYHLGYMTLTEWQKTPKLAERRKAFEDMMDTYIAKEGYKDKNQPFRGALTQEFIKLFRTVFAQNALGELDYDMPTCVNAALVLPTFAKLENLEIVDFLTDLVRDRGKPAAAWAPALTGLGASPFGQGPWLAVGTLAPTRAYGKQEVISLFAFKGLEVFLQNPPKEMDLEFAGTGFLDKAKRQKLANRLNPIIDFILTPPYLASQGEIDGYRFIRCEAIKALAHIPIPYVPDEPAVNPVKAHGKILAPPAYALLRVLAKGEDALYPPPSLEEKVQAALGLCQIKAKTPLDEALPNRYNQEMAAALIGLALSDFVKEYNPDWTVIKEGKKLPPRLPWKVFSKQLSLVLNEGPANFNNPKAVKTITEISSAVQGILGQMEKWQGPVSPDQVNGVLRALPAPNPEVYDKSEYRIKLPWPPV